MSDTIAVMKDGVIVQQGTPNGIYAKPDAVFVADFIGRTNCMTARVVRFERSSPRSLTQIETPIGRLSCYQDITDVVGDSVMVAVRPENVEYIANGGGADGENVVVGDVLSVVFLGNMLDCSVRVGDTQVRVQLHPSSALRSGDRVTLRLPAEHCLVMPA